MTTDRDLQERVLKALEYEPSVDAAQIGVTCHDGVVTLRGSVANYFQKSTAERVTRHVFGVRATANDIEVTPTLEMRRSDSAIAEAAANALSWDVAVPADAVKVTVQNGWVTLTGSVDWRYQQQAAEETVRRLYGVTGVINWIALKPKVRPSDVKARIESAFKRSAEIDAQRIHVDAVNGQVTLTGTVRSMSERLEAERAAWAAAGVTLVDDRLAVAP